MGVPVITGTSFLSNTSAALHLGLPGISLDISQVSGNSYANNGRNGVVLEGNLSGDSLLAKNPAGMMYVLSGLTVNSGAHLDLAAGAVVKMDTVGQLR